MKLIIGFFFFHYVLGGLVPQGIVDYEHDSIDVLTSPVNNASDVSPIIESKGSIIPSSDEHNGPFQTIYVSDLQDVEENYSNFLHEKEKNLVFVLKNSNTYLIRATSDRSKQDDQTFENIDQVGTSSNDELNLENQGFPFFKDKKKPKKVPSERKASKQNDDVEYIEVGYEDQTQAKYPGFVPVSSCQSQEYGDTGTITFGWTAGFSVTNSASIGTSIALGVFTIGLNAGLELESTLSVGGSTTCSIPKGVIGQVLIRPTYVSVTPRSRRVKFKRSVQKFLTDGEFKQHDKIHALLQGKSYQVECATSDVVPLFCEGHKLGELDWENPLGADYDDKVNKKATVMSELDFH